MNHPPPIPFAPYSPQPVSKPERGAFLTITLVGRFILDVLAILVSLGMMSALSTAAESGVRSAQAHQLGNLVTIALVTACLDLASVAGILSWKKWGVYLLGACEAIAIVLRVNSGQTTMAFTGFLTIACIGLAIAVRWRHFD